MQYQITKTGFAPILKFHMKAGENVTIENTSMVYMDGNIELKGRTNGGIFKAIIKSATTGEDYFITNAEAKTDAILACGPSSFGDIRRLECGDEQFIINDGAFLACDNGVEYEIKRVKGIGKALFGDVGGFFNMATNGTGGVYISAFGSIEEVTVKAGQVFTADNGHVVAWSKHLQTNLKPINKFFGFKTGEGLIMQFLGEGKVYIQSRQLDNFANSLVPFLPYPITPQ